MIHGTGIAFEVSATGTEGIVLGGAVEFFASLVWDDCGAVGVLVSVSLGGRVGAGVETPLGAQLHAQYLIALGVDCISALNVGPSVGWSADGHAGVGFGLDIEMSGGPKPQLFIKVGVGAGTKVDAVAKLSGGFFHKLFILRAATCPCPPPPWWVSALGWVPVVGWVAPVLWHGADPSSPPVEAP